MADSSQPRFATSAGVRLAYQTAGAGDPPMIFVHGWSCDRSWFPAQYAHFAASHAVASLDLRGHGGSSQPGPAAGGYDVGVLATDVVTVAAAAGLSQPVVVGHSLGALIGLACAARPGSVRALVMLDPAPITNERAKAYFRESAAAVSADQDGAWRRSFISGMFLPTDSTRQAGLLEKMIAAPPAVAAAVMRAMGEFDGAGALSQITVPVLSIGSARPSNASADLRRLCPGISIGQTVGSGHFNQLEVPEQVNAMIERFLAVNGLSQGGPSSAAC